MIIIKILFQSNQSSIIDNLFTWVVSCVGWQGYPANPVSDIVSQKILNDKKESNKWVSSEESCV